MGHGSCLGSCLVHETKYKQLTYFTTLLRVFPLKNKVYDWTSWSIYFYLGVTKLPFPLPFYTLVSYIHSSYPVQVFVDSSYPPLDVRLSTLTLPSLVLWWRVSDSFVKIPSCRTEKTSYSTSYWIRYPQISLLMTLKSRTMGDERRRRTDRECQTKIIRIIRKNGSKGLLRLGVGTNP